MFSVVIRFFLIEESEYTSCHDLSNEDGLKRFHDVLNLNNEHSLFNSINTVIACLKSLLKYCKNN